MTKWFLAVVIGGLLAAGCGDNLKPAGQDAAAPPDAPVTGDAGTQEDATAAEDASTDGSAPDDASPGDDGLLGFGAVCTDNTQCESNVCHDFTQGTWCTITCVNNGDCPDGSQGKKCNNEGYCRP